MPALHHPDLGDPAWRATMDSLADIDAALQQRGDLRWVRSETCVRIGAPHAGGFTIEIARDGDEWIVSLGEAGYHQHFDDPREALDFLAWAASPNCRLREVRQAGRVLKCILEAREAEEWRAVGAVGFFSARFWGRREEVVLQN